MRLPPVLAAVVAAVAFVATLVASAACSAPAPQKSSAPLSSSAQAPFPSASEPSDPTPRSPDDLSGTWKLLMGRTQWTVRLAPRRGLPGEYLGIGERETRDDEGRMVTMEIGAVRENGDFRAWLGPGVITCKGAYRVDEAIEGDCVEMGGDAAGRFRAERVARVTR